MVNPSASKILRHIIYDKFGDARERTYIIMGRAGHTGKIWLCDELKAHGFNAIEISGDILLLVDYKHTDENYVIRNKEKKQTIIVLNRPFEEVEA